MIYIGRTWTRDEDLLLSTHYGKMDAKEMVGTGMLDRSVHAVHQRAFKIGLKSPRRHKKYHGIKLDYFKEPNIESAYWAGFICADGTLVKHPSKPNTHYLGIVLSSKDIAHLAKFQKSIGHTGEIKTFMSRGSSIGDQIIRPTEMCRLHICQAGRFVDDLAKLGIIQDKTKRIPPPQLENVILKLVFLKGYIDGDGCLSVTSMGKVRIGIISSCEIILHWFRELIEANFPTEYMDREHSNINPNKASATWQYNIAGYRALRIIEILSRIPTPELERKWKRPELLERLAAAKDNPLFAEKWAIRLPIEDEIDAYVKNLSIAA